MYIKHNIIHLSFKSLYFTCVQDDVQVAQRYTKELSAKKTFCCSLHRCCNTARGQVSCRAAIHPIRSPSSLTASRQGLGAPKPAPPVPTACLCSCFRWLIFVILCLGYHPTKYDSICQHSCLMTRVCLAGQPISYSRSLSSGIARGSRSGWKK